MDAVVMVEECMDVVKPGDQVVYIDIDHILWGPWQVISVSKKELEVHVEDTITLFLGRNKVHKLGAF